MRKVQIITDSTADLSKELLEELQIDSLPLYVRFGETIYKDGVDINTNELYQLVDNHNQIPTTAAISPGDFYEKFKYYLDRELGQKYLLLFKVPI